MQEYFVYFAFFKLHSWVKRSADNRRQVEHWVLKKRNKPASQRCRLYFLLQAETLVETVNTSTGVNQLLLAGIEGVALGADFNTDVLLGGAGGENVTTSAADSGLLVVGMDTFLHFVHLFLIM